jgi:hypothetical protein
MISILILTNFSLPAKASLESELQVTEVNFFGSLDFGDKCRFDKDLSQQSLCSYDKWIELYNPTSEAVNLTNYKLFTEPFGESIYNKNNAGSEIISLFGVVIPAKSNIILKDGFKNLSSPIRSDYNLVNLFKISTKEGLNNYQKIGFYISLNAQTPPVLNFSLPDQTINTSSLKTIEFCSGNLNFATSILFSNQKASYSASPKTNCFTNQILEKAEKIPELETSKIIEKQTIASAQISTQKNPVTISEKIPSLQPKAKVVNPLETALKAKEIILKNPSQKLNFQLAGRMTFQPLKTNNITLKEPKPNILSKNTFLLQLSILNLALAFRLGFSLFQKIKNQYQKIFSLFQKLNYQNNI